MRPLADEWSRENVRLAALSVFSSAAEHPVLRPRPNEAAERVAATLPAGDRPVPRPAVEEVLGSFAASEVGRLVGIAAESAPARWLALVAEVGDELAREPLLVGVATASIEELLPPPRWLVAMREASSDQAPSPIDVMATLLNPQSVWSASECEAARAVFRPCPLPQGLAAIRSFARSEITEWHLERARYVARPVGRLLPLPEAPRTSIQLGQSLELVEEREGSSELCELLLFGAVARLTGLVQTAPSCN